MWFLEKWRRRKPRAAAASLREAPGRDMPAEAFLLACGVETVIEDHLAPGTADPAVRRKPASAPNRRRAA